MKKREKKQPTSGTTTRLRMRFLFTLFRVKPGLEDSLFENVESLAARDNEISYTTLICLRDTIFLKWQKDNGLPAWNWFPELARYFLENMYFWETGIQYYAKDDNSTVRECVEKMLSTEYIGRWNCEYDKFEVTGWIQQVQNEQEFRDSVQWQLDDYIAKKRPLAPKIKKIRESRTDLDKRLEITARRFFGETPSEICDAVVPGWDVASISRTVKEICKRLEIDAPKQRPVRKKRTSK